MGFCIKNKYDKYKVELWSSLIIVASTLIFAFTFYNLWDYDFNIPLFYGVGDGDGTFIHRVVKGIYDNGNMFYNYYMGAPFGSVFFEFPFYGDALHFGVLELLSNIFENVSKAINVYYITLFPLTSLISYYVMKSLKVNNLLSILGSIVFTFLPFRFLRGLSHLFLSAYYMIPVAVLILIWLSIDDDFFILNKQFFEYKRNCIGLLGLVIISITGMYYAFFFCFFVLVLSFVKLINNFNKTSSISGSKKSVFSITVIMITIFVFMMPTLISSHKYGESMIQVIRSPIESEIYGMKIAQLFIPNQSHGNQYLDKIINAYANAPLPNEGSEYLGIIGIVGFISLIILLFYKSNINKPYNSILNILANLNIASILLATIGGFGSLFALLISPQIRAYNRISVYIAYFSILSVCIILTNLLDKASIRNRSKAHNLFIQMFIIIVFIFSILEQGIFIKDGHTSYLNQYHNDSSFIKEIENVLNEDSMIFQLPYQAFPEMPPINNMPDYAQSIGYIHSEKLKWSYGEFKGRVEDSWTRETSSLEIPDMLERISVAGFEGLYINKNGYNLDEFENLINELDNILKIEPLYSSDGNLVFYNLSKYNKSLRMKYTIKEWEDKKRLNVDVIPVFLNGFYDKEKSIEGEWIWCNKSGDLLIKNRTEEIIPVKIRFKAYTGYQDESELILKTFDEENKYNISSNGNSIDLDINLIPGNNKIEFITNSEQVDAPGDMRSLYFNIQDFKIELLDN